MRTRNPEPGGAAPGLPGDADEDVRRAARGDEEAFERLVARYQDDAVRAAYYFLRNEEDAADVAQEAFLKAYLGLPKFRGGSAFRTWLLAIVLNCARSLETRRHAKKRGGPTASLDAPPYRDDENGPRADVPDSDLSSGPATLLERKELKEAIEQALAELEPRARELVVLRDLAGESYEAIAEATGLPIGTVKSGIHRARRELQEKLAAWVG